MMARSGLDGLSSALLSIAADGDQVALFHRILDRYFHRFRNRLNSMKLSLYLGRRDSLGSEVGLWSELEGRYQTIERFLDQIQNYCRPFELTPIEAPLDLFLEERRQAWEHRHSSRGLEFDLNPPEQPAFGQFDPSRLAQGLDALAAWRVESLPVGTSIRLQWAERDGWLHLHWEEPQVRNSCSKECAGDSPIDLALPILARIVQAHGGTLDVSLQSGFALTLKWPRFRRTP